MMLLPDNLNYFFYESIDSTNIKAREYLEHGSVIIAAEQTGGRGRYGNDWVSPKGNLYMSLVCQVSSFEVAGQYAFLTAVALEAAIQSVSENGVSGISLKWPNDVLINKKKLAGILLETEERNGEIYLIIGVGVNLISSPDYATNLNHELNQLIETKTMLDSFIFSFKKMQKTFEKKGFLAVKNKWLEKACGIGKHINVRLQNNNMNGIFAGIDDNGALLLKDSDGSITHVTSGEVFFT